MFKEGLLKGKRILITGGGTGLGKEIAARYLAARRRAVDRRTPRRCTGRNGPGIHREIRGKSTDPRGRHPRRRGGRRDGAAHLGRERAAHRPGQQRRRQFHQPDEGPHAERLQRHRQHRVPRHVLRDAGRGQALDRRRPQGHGDLDPRHLGAHRLAVRRALGDVEGRPARDDQVARGRMGPVRHPPQRHRARPVPDRGRLQAPASRRKSSTIRARSIRCGASARWRSCRTSPPS